VDWWQRDGAGEPLPAPALVLPLASQTPAGRN
jgi:hypothetical protein